MYCASVRTEDEINSDEDEIDYMEYAMYAAYGGGALVAIIVLYCCYKKCCNCQSTSNNNKQMTWNSPQSYGGPDLEMDNRSNYGKRPPTTNRVAPPVPFAGGNSARQAPIVPNQYPPKRAGPPVPPPVPPVPSSNRFAAPVRQAPPQRYANPAPSNPRPPPPRSGYKQPAIPNNRPPIPNTRPPPPPSAYISVKNVKTFQPSHNYNQPADMDRYNSTNSESTQQYDYRPGMWQ